MRRKPKMMLSFLQYLWLTLIQPAFHHLPIHTTTERLAKKKENQVLSEKVTVYCDCRYHLGYQCWVFLEHRCIIQKRWKAFQKLQLSSYLVHTHKELWCLSLHFVVLCVRMKRETLSQERARTRMDECLLICSPKYWRTKPQFN